MLSGDRHCISKRTSFVPLDKRLSRLNRATHSWRSTLSADMAPQLRSDLADPSELTRRSFVVGLAAASVALANRPEPRARAHQQPDATPADSPADTEWPAYANDPGGMRHSRLTQINRENVGSLTPAWGLSDRGTGDL